MINSYNTINIFLHFPSLLAITMRLAIKELHKKSTERNQLLFGIRKMGEFGKKGFLVRPGLFMVLCALSCAGHSFSNASVLASISFNSLTTDKQLGQPREIYFMTSFSGGYI